ncbi:hypothetical protein LA080_007836 [Diaporthe eres]|nr:hypothetical protein LA080_007836 [Diaporthe eres]
MDCGHVLDVCSLAENTPFPDEQSRGCKISSGQQIPSVQGRPVTCSEVSLSYGPDRKQGNINDFDAFLAYIFSKLYLLPTSGYKGQRNRPGIGDGSGSNNTHSTEPYSISVFNSTAHTGGFGPLPPDQNRQMRKRFRDDDGPFPPNKLPTHDEGDSVQRLLCPFYVKDRHPFHACSNRRFKRTSDVRQHIGRVHIQPPHCPTCGERFDNDRSRNRHIAVRTCRTQLFSIPGITVEQFDTITAIAGNRYRPSEVERWLRMFRVIFPGVEDPVSPYSSGESDLVQGMLDVRAAIENGQAQAFSSGASVVNFGPDEWSIIERFTSVARQLQRGHNRAPTLANSLQPPSGEPASIHAAQGHSIQPQASQAGGHGLAADPLSQSHAPPLVRPSDSQDSDGTGIYRPDFGEGSSQSLSNQDLPWEYFFEEFGHYPWDPHRQA